MLIKAADGVNPYEVNHHVDGCEVEIWDGDQLIGEKELAARRCGACTYEWRLWGRILEKTADPETGEQTPIYGDLAMRGLWLETLVREFHSPIHELDAWDWELLQIAHQARNEYEAFKAYRQAKEANERQ